MNEGNPIAGIILLIIMFTCYMIPALIASSRKHPQTAAITALNLLTGWTFIGWVAALVWSFTNSTYHPQDERRPPRDRRRR